MFHRRGSLKKKIIYGYVAGFLIVLVSAGFILVNLVFLEERIRFFEVITRFVDTVLEIRRYEKNYFLYNKQEDLKRAVQYIDYAMRLLRSNRGSFDAIEVSVSGNKNTSYVAEEMLSRYRMLLLSTRAVKSGSSRIKEIVRQAGHDLTALAEQMAETERRIIHRTITSTKQSLVISVGIFFTGTLAIALLVSTIVIKPLQRLEQSMDRIASGRFEMLPIESDDKEILSLRRAFERMIREIFSQRDIIRSEKLTSLGTMLAGIAHEINNPLNNISTSAEILKEELDGSDREFKGQLLEQILSETDRARDIVRSVLEYTRDKDFKTTEIALKDLIQETLRFIKNDFPSHITLSLDIVEGVTVWVDKQKFQHALLNIIKNAIEAMQDRTQQARLTITAGKTDQDHVEIMISDTGHGIAEEIIGKIFDPFFTTKEPGRGTGLGLFVTHYIVEQHRGSISVDSVPGKGTTFTIKIPIREDTNERPGQDTDN